MAKQLVRVHESEEASQLDVPPLDEVVSNVEVEEQQMLVADALEEAEENTRKAEEEESLPEGVPGGAFGVWNSKAVSQTGRKILLYGESGTGKTTLACTFPRPVVLDLDGGLLSVTHLRPLRYPKNPRRKVTKFSELAAFYTICKEELKLASPSFQTIVIDSLNELQDLVLEHVVQDYKGTRQYDDTPTLGDYGKALRDFARIVKGFKDLPCDVIFIAGSAPKQYPDEQSSPHFVGKKTIVQISRMMDLVGYCFTTFGTNKQDLLYRVNFSNTPEHLGKNRLKMANRDYPNKYSEIFLKEAANGN